RRGACVAEGGSKAHGCAPGGGVAGGRGNGPAARVVPSSGNSPGGPRAPRGGGRIGPRGAARGLTMGAGGGGRCFGPGGLSVAAGGSITLLIARIKEGDGVASQRIWDAYFQRLVALARARLRAAPRGRRGGRGAERLRQLLPPRRRGEFPRLDDRDDLW